MRTKVFAMSIGLAASAWLTGCQTTPSGKHAALGSKDAAVCKSGNCKDAGCADGSCKPAVASSRTSSDSTARLTRLANRAKSPPSSVPPAPCTACAKCGTKCDTETAKTTDAPGSCSTCAARTGSANDNAWTPSAALLASQKSPQPFVPTSNATPRSQPTPVPATLPASATLPSAPAIVPVPLQQPEPSPATIGIVANPSTPTSYGPGVDIVASPQPIEAPAALPGERVVADNVMTVRFGQANNYQIVVGQVYQYRRAWKLRYTAVESDDKYGGSFTLVGDSLDNLKDGQMVRVEGTVLQTDDRVGGVRYQVNRVEVIEPK